MKKTLTINLGGRVFHIDEDAYALLESYLLNVGNQFGEAEERKEFLTQLEKSMGELIDRHLPARSVLDIESVRFVLASISAEYTLGGNHIERGRGASFAAMDPVPSQGAIALPEDAGKKQHQYYREMDRSLLCGVLSGLSLFAGWRLWLVRVVFLLLFALFSFWGIGWLLLFAYLSLWMIVPPVTTASDKLRLVGKPLTMENIAQMVAEEADRTERKTPSAVSKFGCVLKSLLVGGAIVLFFFLLLSLVGVLMGFFNILFTYIPGGYTLAHLPDGLTLVANVSVLTIILIPLIALFVKREYNADTSLANRWVKWLAIGVWFAAIAVLMVVFVLLIQRVGLGILPFFHKMLV